MTTENLTELGRNTENPDLELFRIDSARLADIDSFAERSADAVVHDIARLVAIPSVEGSEEPDAPFGCEVKRALDCALAIAGELGLKTVNCGNRIAYAVAGEDCPDRYLATITHLDVVPAGDGWEDDPFTLREQDGYLLGRGVMDDKGPSVLCLYALKYLQDSGLPLRYPVRALLGCNEETGMGEVQYYLDNYPAPLLCISPDANFPLINGEKGIYHGLLRSHPLAGNVLDISGGVAANAVPAAASVRIHCEKQLADTDRVHAELLEPGLWQLSSVGISGHASLPAGTVNAIGLLVKYLLENDLLSEEEVPYFRYLDKLHSFTDGSGLGLAGEDGRFTALTAVGGKISTENGIITQTIDIRYGTAMSGEKLTALLKEAAGGAAEVEVTNDNAPFWLDPENPAVKACIDSYNLVTGEQAQPVTIGGGTYARHFPNAFAFGPEHPERPMPDFCGPIHGINEAACRSDMIEALKIYIQAMIRLQALDY